MKKTVLDTQLDELIMHSIKQRKKASEPMEKDEARRRERRKKKRKKRKMKNRRNVPKLVETAFAFKNRAIREDCTDTAVRIARLDGILIASIKLDACSRCELNTRSRYRGIHFVISVAV